MSSGSAASRLLNGEAKKENVDGYGYGNKKENESGAAGSTGSSSLIVLAGDNSNDTDTTTIVTVTSGGVVVGAGTTAVPSGASNNGRGSGRRSGSNGNGDSDSNSNSGVCVTGLIAGGVVGVEFCDVNPDLRIPDNYEEIRVPRDVNSISEYGEAVFQEAYTGTFIEEAPILDLTAATTTISSATTTAATASDTTTIAITDTNTAAATATTIGIIERDDRTATVPALYYEEDEEEDNEEEDDNMVAAMNEHLSNASTTSGVRNNTVSTTTVAGNSVVNQSNSCNEYENVGDDGKPAAGILSFPCDFDHMYASMTDGGGPAVATATSTLGVSPLRGNEPRQNDHTEVKHLKELLLLHLDLIQQQSEQIVTKDKLLAALRQENETLKLRLERMDRRVNLQKLRSENNESSIGPEHIGACSPSAVNAVNVPSTSELNRNVQSENNNSQYNESFKIRLNTSGGITTVKQEPNDNQSKHETKVDPGNDIRLEWEEKKKRRTDPVPLSSGSKRKRGVSCSSTISNDASTVQDKTLTQEGSRKSDRKGKPLTKKESFLSTEEHYYTAVGDPNYTLSLKEPCPIESDTSLEVPNWRVKIYTSCYTMEGTENLDDEIFNKRHLKLENDERRRKRWDVQRIREQRHIEKLKQRQERQNHQATCYNTNHTGPCPSTVEEEQVSSLWPDVEQIQSLQVDPQLPVTAFGAPIPSFTPSEFSLPWSNTTRSNSRRPKRSTGRRKSTRR